MGRCGELGYVEVWCVVRLCACKVCPSPSPRVYVGGGLEEET